MEAVAGLDIGSSRVIAVVSCTKDTVPGFSAKGLKYGYSSSMGIRKGQITDVASLADSMREALDMAESAAGVRVEAVYAAFPGHTVEFYIKESGNLIGKGRRISQQDLERAKRLALVSELPQGRRVIQAIPFEYRLDGSPVNGDPTGMACTRLSVESLVITADNGFMDMMAEAAYRAGVRIIDCLPSTLAAGEVALDSARRQVGTALVDIGESSTCITRFNHGRPVAYEAVPVGSGHITSDLAICLRTTLEDAELIKKEVGLIGEGETAGDDIAVPRLSGLGFNQIPRNTVVRVIEARVGEILEMARSSVNRMNEQSDLPGGIVLAGGGSLIRGMDPFASEYLGCKIALGAVSAVEDGLGDGDNAGPGTDLSGAKGLIKYFSEKPPVLTDSRPQEDFWSKVKGFFWASK